MIDTAVRDACWLNLALNGTPVERIAADCGVTERAVQIGIRRAVEGGEPAERKPLGVPELMPWFGVPTGWTPDSPCWHRKPDGTVTKVPRGSRYVCMKCQKSGWDHHADLHVPYSERPKPYRAHAPKIAKGTSPAGKETRRQRRARGVYGTKKSA